MVGSMPEITAYPTTVAHVLRVVVPDEGPDSRLLDAGTQEASVSGYQHNIVSLWVAGRPAGLKGIPSIQMDAEPR